jgi:GNAT superfamily N-acetyltransferase
MPTPAPLPHPTSTLTTPTEPPKPISDIAITLANPSHTDTLVTLINEAFYSDTTGEAWLTDARSPVAHESFITPMLSDPDIRFLIATAADKPEELLACCFVRWNPSSAAPSQDPSTARTTAWLGFLCVSPSVHGTGLGGKMLDYAESFIQREWPQPGGPTRVEINVVNTRKGLMGYYERKGFTATGRSTPFPYGNHKGDGIIRDDLAMVDFGKALKTGD